MRFKDWLETILGPEWVVAPKNKQNLERYHGYTFLTSKQFQQLKDKYEEKTGLKAD